MSLRDAVADSVVSASSVPVKVRGAPAAIAIDLKRAIAVWWAAATLVIALGLLRELVLPMIGTGTVLQDLRHFAFDAERSLPACYGSLTMAASALMLLVIAALSPRDDPENIWHWRGLAAIFLFLSVDEAVAFHETTMAPLRAALGFTGFLHFSWVVIAAPLLVAAGLAYLPFLMRLPARWRLRFVLAGSLFVAGAFGLELVGGYFASTEGMHALSYRIEATLEECLETVGVTLFAVSLAALIAERAPSLTFRLGGAHRR